MTETWLIERKLNGVWERMAGWEVHGTLEEAIKTMKYYGHWNPSFRACRYEPTDVVAESPGDDGDKESTVGHA